MYGEHQALEKEIVEVNISAKPLKKVRSIIQIVIKKNPKKTV